VEVFRVMVVYYVCSDTKEQAEEEIVKCCGTFYDTMQAEKVTTISTQPKATIVADWLKPKVYKGEEEEVQF
jgi:hypothetical protein